MTQISRIEGSI